MSKLKLDARDLALIKCAVLATLEAVNKDHDLGGYHSAKINDYIVNAIRVIGLTDSGL